MLRRVKERCAKYAFNGIIGNLTTQTPYFPPGYGYRSLYLMNDFLRSIRRELERRGDKHGRRMVVAVQVFESLIVNP